MVGIVKVLQWDIELHLAVKMHTEVNAIAYLMQTLPFFVSSNNGE